MSLVTQLTATQAWLDSIITGGITEKRRGYMVAAAQNAMDMVVRARTSLDESLLVPHGDWTEMAMRWTVKHRIDMIHTDLDTIVILCDGTHHPLPGDLIVGVRARTVGLIKMLEEIDVISMPRVGTE